MAKHDHSLLLILLALFLFHSPFTRWWAGLDLPWYTMYLLWMFVILLIAVNQITSVRRGD